MALPKSVCDDCINAECLWRAPTGGSDPPVMVCPSKIEKPQTKADHIRAMTDEELTRFFAENCGCGEWCMHNRSGACSSKNEDECCLDVWYRWLKSPAEEGEG